MHLTHIQTYKYTRKRARGGSAHAFTHGQRLSDTREKSSRSHSHTVISPYLSVCVPTCAPAPPPAALPIRRERARARTHVDAHTRTYARKIFVKIRRCGYTESAVVDNPHEISSLPDAPSHPRLHLLHTSSTSSTSSTSFSSFSYHPLSLVVANLSLGEKVGKEWGGSIFTGATVLLLLPHAPSCIHIALPPPTFPSLFPHILYFSELAMLCPVPVVMHRLRPG